MSSLQSSFVLSTYVYTVEAVRESGNIFEEVCTVELGLAANEILVTLTLRADSPAPIADEFLNYALNLSIEQTLTGV